MRNRSAPPSVVSPELRNSLASRYVIEGEIGRGAMAVVYRARDLKHNRSVAIKILPEDLSRSLGSARFAREIEIAAGLTHTNILTLHDSGKVGECLYYVMPFVDGESLRDRLDRERVLPIDEALRIASEVASALDYAHRRRVVHRDIKPGNILLQDGSALVADFGVARVIKEASGKTLTATGLTLGTPSYMSPEQGSGDRGLDGRSDVYSLGCVLYEMLAGAPPYTGRTAQGVIAKHLIEPIPHIRSARPDVPVRIEAILTRSLQKIPADRYDTAAAFRAALNSARFLERRRRIFASPLAWGIGTVVLATVVAIIFEATRR